MFFLKAHFDMLKPWSKIFTASTSPILTSLPLSIRPRSLNLQDVGITAKPGGKRLFFRSAWSLKKKARMTPPKKKMSSRTVNRKEKPNDVVYLLRWWSILVATLGSCRIMSSDSPIHPGKPFESSAQVVKQTPRQYGVNRGGNLLNPEAFCCCCIIWKKHTGIRNMQRKWNHKNMSGLIKKIIQL